MELDRDRGYYWIKYHGEWMPAEWASSFWMIIGYDGTCNDDEFDEIGEEISH